MVIGFIFAIILIIWIVSGSYQSFIDSIINPQTSTNQQVVSGNMLDLCKGNAECFAGEITRVHDGDTLYVDGRSIRLALTNTTELKDVGGTDVREFTLEICPIGSTAVVDEDDGQIQGSYDRMVAVVYCNGVNLNAILLEELVEFDLASIDTRYCDDSEFADEDWAKKYGC